LVLLAPPLGVWMTRWEVCAGRRVAGDRARLCTQLPARRWDSRRLYTKMPTWPGWDWC